MEKILFQIGCFYGASAVAFGAMGAHFLKSRLDTIQMENFKTAVLYQMFHAILLVALTFNGAKFAGPVMNYAVWLFVVGVFFFSGSIYVLSLKDLLGLVNTKWIGPVTPIGGLCLILGWCLLLFKGYRAL